MTSDKASLELTVEEMRSMTDRVATRVIDHIATLGEQSPTGDLSGVEDLCRSITENSPEEGTDLDALLEPLFEEWIPASFNSAGPGYLAYVPGGGVFPSALADLIADGVNRYTGVWHAAPALIQLEANVLNWFRDWMGFPKSTRGLLTTGGSMATFSAIVAARTAHLGEHLRDGVLYSSNQAHHCVAKAAHLAGILSDRCRMIRVGEDMRMDVAALERAIAEDRRAGRKPFMVVTAAGTTNTGAVDPLGLVADVCEREGLWHHVDGAYGAFFHMCPELQPALSGLSRCDSITLDPHKGLFLPYGTGALLVRDGDKLRAAHQVSAGYLPDTPAEEFYDPCQYGPELSRDFRGLRAWLPLKLFGVARFRHALLEKHQLAVACSRALAAMEGIRLCHEPALSLFAFVVDRGLGLAQQNEDTRELLRRVCAKGRVMITGASVVIDGSEVHYARVCVLCFRTREAHVNMAIEDIQAALSEITSAQP